MMDEIIDEEQAIAEEQLAEEAALESAITKQPIRRLSTLRPPVCVSRGVSVREAVDAMNRGRVGCVLVVEGERLVGIFTERDVLTKVVGPRLDPDRTSLDEVMTPDPETLTADDVIGYALNKMSVGGFRHIPLVDDQGRPTGVVAMRNIVDYLVDLFPREVLNLPPSPAHAVSRAREGA